MIQSLKLKDFQAHEELEIAFSSGVTTIKGPSDRGKSAILRALRWACLNDLPGEEFIREGAKRTEVELRVDRKRIVRGRGGPGGNSYSLGEEEFKAFGSSVPEPIAKLLSLSELNFQGQHDAPFWFSEPAPEVSRQLNAIIDLSVIDTSLAFVSGVVRQEQDRLVFAREDLAKIQEEREEAEKERPRVEAFTALLVIKTRLERRKERHGELAGLLDQIQANRATELREKAQDREKVLAAARASLAASRQHDALKELLSSIEGLKKKALPPPDFTPVETAYASARLWKTRTENLRALLGSINNAMTLLSTRVERAETAEERFHEKTSGERCPLCGEALKSKYRSI